MNRLILRPTLILACLTASIFSAAAQTSDASADHSAPSYDMKAQALVDLERVQKKFVDLANAVAANKLTWRPSEDSRSFAEVFLHVPANVIKFLHLGAQHPRPTSMERHLRNRPLIGPE